MSRIAVPTLLVSAIAAAALADDPPVLRYVPKHEELKYTFGGVAPTHRIKPGTRIVSWTEDCYDGALTRPGQKPSAVLTPGRDNPQTGPFYVEGAEPGDTLVVRIEKLTPARDYAVSVASPGFGALKGTDKTAMLGAELPETVWFYAVDRAKGVARTQSQDGKKSWEVPLAPCLGCLGVSPAYGEARSTIVPKYSVSAGLTKSGQRLALPRPSVARKYHRIIWPLVDAAATGRVWPYTPSPANPSPCIPSSNMGSSMSAPYMTR